MAFQNRKQNFSSQINTTNRQFVSNQTAAAAPASFNNPNPVQMAPANPFATTVENPWGGMNHMLLHSDNMVIQPTPNAQSGQANMLPNGQRNTSTTDSATNQGVTYHDTSFQIPDYAPQKLKEEMIQLRETDRLLCQQSKRIKLQFAEKQNQAVQHLVERARTPLLNKLKEKDAQILNLVNLNIALQEVVKNLLDDNEKRKQLAITWELKAMAEVRRLQGLVPPTEPVPAPHGGEEEHDVKSYCGSNFSEKNAQANPETGATEKGEGSGEERMCMSCGQMRMSVLALPCWHLCFCTVCGSRESSLQAQCPVCKTPITATVPVSIV